MPTSNDVPAIRHGVGVIEVKTLIENLTIKKSQILSPLLRFGGKLYQTLHEAQFVGDSRVRGYKIGMGRQRLECGLTGFEEGVEITELVIVELNFLPGYVEHSKIGSSLGQGERLAGL